MNNQRPAVLVKVWKKLVPHVESMLEDVCLFAIIVVGLVLMHFMRLGLIAMGIETEITTPIRYMEVGAHLANFASLFYRMGLRAVRGSRT
jgi:hypothetical protein